MHDIQYYQDMNIWSLNGEKLFVSEDNKHLGLIVSRTDKEVKNIEKNIKLAREALFGFLGNTFFYKCKISPALQYYVWSGLSALPIRPPVLNTLTVF